MVLPHGEKHGAFKIGNIEEHGRTQPAILQGGRPCMIRGQAPMVRPVERKDPGHTASAARWGETRGVENLGVQLQHG